MERFSERRRGPEAVPPSPSDAMGQSWLRPNADLGGSVASMTTPVSVASAGLATDEARGVATGWYGAVAFGSAGASEDAVPGRLVGTGAGSS